MTNGSTLRKGALSQAEAIGVSLATVAPAFALFGSLGLIVGGAGLGSPLVILLAAVAIAFHINSVAEFNKVMPSAGMYPAYVGRALGPIPGASLGIAYQLAYVAASAGFLDYWGYWTSLTLHKLVGVSIPWWIATVILTAALLFVTIRGVRISSRWAIALFLFEMAVLAAIFVAAIVERWSSLSLAPFSPTHISHGISGIGLVFPLAIYMFLGASYSAPLAEEVENPRKAVPQAIFRTLILAAIIDTLLAWATMEIFHNSPLALVKPAIPMLAAGTMVLGPAAFVMYLAGFTSISSTAITSVNGLARVAMSLGRDGILPRFLRSVDKKYQTPKAALIATTVVWIILGLIMGFAVGPYTAFEYLGTLGTITIIVAFALVNVALPVLFLREHRNRFSWWLHAIAPAIGTVVLILPVISIFAPEPYPYNLLTWMSVGILAVGLILGAIIVWTRHNVKMGQFLATEDSDTRVSG